MNPVFKFLLRLASSPRIDMQEDYQWVRKMQKLFSSAPSARYRILDEKIYSINKDHEIPVRIFYLSKKNTQNLYSTYMEGAGLLVILTIIRARALI